MTVTFWTVSEMFPKLHKADVTVPLTLSECQVISENHKVDCCFAAKLGNDVTEGREWKKGNVCLSFHFYLKPVRLRHLHQSSKQKEAESPAMDESLIIKLIGCLNPPSLEGLHALCPSISLPGNIIRELTTTVSAQQDLPHMNAYSTAITHSNIPPRFIPPLHCGWIGGRLSLCLLEGAFLFPPPLLHRPEGSSWTLRVASEARRRKNRQIRDA